MGPNNKKSILQFGSGALLVAMTFSLYFYFTSSPPSQYHDAKYVFINQTHDHRFDDSIRTTILANQSRANVQNAVVIVNEIPKNKTLESWPHELFKTLHLGAKTNGKAILYLFVPSQNLLRIEVSVALEGILPDAKLKSLEAAAKSFTFSDRMHDFWSDLINTINVAISGQSNGGATSYNFENWKYLSNGAGVSSRDYKFSADQLKKEFRSIGGADLNFLPKSTATETLNLYLKSLSEGVGDSNLQILSTGSQIYRRHTPLNRALLERMSSMYEEAMPYSIAESKNAALVWFQPRHPVLPIFLFRDKRGQWLVHEPYSFSIFNRFEDSMSIFQTQPVTDRFGIFDQTGLAKNVICYGAPPYLIQLLNGDEFFSHLSALESAIKSAPTAENYQALGDFYHFELLDELSAYYTYHSAPHVLKNTRLLWRLIPVLLNLGRIKEFIRTYDQLAQLNATDARLQETSKFYWKALTFNEKEWRSTF